MLCLGEEEGSVILTCHHAVATGEREDLRVRLPTLDGELGNPVKVVYDEERSQPEQDAAVLRVYGNEALPAALMPLLHKLDADTYEGSLGATVLTRLTPDSFDATVRPSTPIDVGANPDAGWPNTPQRYRLRVFRLANATDSRPGFSGGVVFCEGGVLGLAHFGRGEKEQTEREDYMVPLSAWAEGWPALEELIEPLVDGKLRGAATVKRVADLGVGFGADVTIAGYRPDVYAAREADERAKRILRECGGVVVVGRPLSGKSRLVVELLRANPRTIVVAPNQDATSPPEGFEASGLRGLDVILLFDDLHYIARSARPLSWVRAFSEATGRSCKIVCASRDGAEWGTLEAEQQHLLQFLGRDEAIVFTSRVEGRRHKAGEELSDEQGWNLAQDLDIGAAEFERRFDGTPGSLLLDLDEMSRRYESLSDDYRGGVCMSRLLDSVKVLLRARHPGFSHEVVRAVAERVRGAAPIDEETWEALLRKTREQGFAQLDEESGSIRYYTPYLERCVDYEVQPRDLHALETIFEEKEDALGLFYLVPVYGHDLRDPERAFSCAEKALELEPDSADSWYNKSYALNGVARFDESLGAVERALSLNPEYHPAYYSKGFALSGLERYVEAADAFREAIRLGEGTYPGIISMYFHGLGTALADMGRFYEGLWAGMQAIHLYPPYEHTPRLLCRLLLGEAGLHEFALEACEFMLLQDPDWAEAWCAKGDVLVKMGRHKEALAAYEEALEAQPHLAEAWYGKGLILLMMSDAARDSDRIARYLTMDGAEDVARELASRSLEATNRAVTLGEDAPSTRLNKGVALSRLRRYPESLTVLTAALEKYPEFAQILHNRGVIHLMMRRYDDALKDFQNAVRLKPTFASSWWGIVLLMGGHHNQQCEALLAVDNLIGLRPRNATSWFAKGCILSKLGRPEVGRFWLRCARSVSRSGHRIPVGAADGTRLFFAYTGPADAEPDDRHRTLGSGVRSPMQAMLKRFKDDLSPEQQDVLRTLKLLDFAGVEELSLRRLKAVLESQRLFGVRSIDLDKALRVLAEQAYIDRPASQDPVQPEVACLWEAVIYRKGKRIEEDLGALADVLYVELADYEGLSDLSGSYAQVLHDNASALACADRAIALKPDFAPAWGNRSSALGNMGRHTEALEAIEEAGKLVPEHPTALYNKGLALNQLGRYAEALAVFDEMVRSWPDNPDVLLGRGEALVGLDSKDEGTAEFKRAGELRPDDPEFAKREGAMLLASGDQEGALSAVNRALRVRPDDHSAFVLKATALMAADRNDEAIAWFLRAWSVRHRFPDGGTMIAEMLRGLGHDPETEVP